MLKLQPFGRSNAGKSTVLHWHRQPPQRTRAHKASTYSLGDKGVTDAGAD
jgi:hypothetical protein